MKITINKDGKPATKNASCLKAGTLFKDSHGDLWLRCTGGAILIEGEIDTLIAYGMTEMLEEGFFGKVVEVSGDVSIVVTLT